LKNNLIKKFSLAINASRARSGGAVLHLLELIKSIKKYKKLISSVHIWTYESLALKIINNKFYENKFFQLHVPHNFFKSIFWQIIWEKYYFPTEFKKSKCDILLNIHAGSFARIRPCVTMSRDMLSYEKDIAKSFGFGTERLRIEILRYVQNQSLRFANASIFLTKYAKRIIIKNCGKINKSFIVNHGISSIFKRKKKYISSSFFPLRSIYISNLMPYKNHIEVIKAFEILKNKINIKIDLTLDFNCKNNSGYKKKFFKKLLSIDPDKKLISCIGEIPHSKIPRLMEKYDIFIFASTCETMPNTLLEAMRMGMPIACSNSGPMQEILKDGGVYFNPKSPLSIANSVLLLAQNKDLRYRLSKKAFNLSKVYSWDKCTKNTVIILMKTLINFKKNYFVK
jgi:glycosyltransferase involved in cell wall biosynthesis